MYAWSLLGVWKFAVVQECCWDDCKLWHVGVAIRRRQQRVQVVLEGKCSLWSTVSLATTPKEGRASQ